MLPLSGKRVTVVGLGISGAAAAMLLDKESVQLALTDDKTEVELKDVVQSLEGVKADYRLGGIDSELLLESDMIIISPGVPSDLVQIERARRAGVVIVSEIELAYWFSEAPLIAITGTNGKTTTTMLIHHIIAEAGLKTSLAGNIEIPLSRVVREGPQDVIVVEVSSFQLENIESFRPRIGVLLNISPDHLDRYPSMKDYCEAKARLFMNQSGSDYAVLNRDDPMVVQIAERISSTALWFSMKEEVECGVFLRNEALVARFGGDEKEITTIEGIPLFGRHNVENVLAAIASTLPIGVPIDICRRAIGNFQGVEHRLEKVCEKRGILFVNDSKATNIGALEKALESFERPIILIAGGRGKESDYRVLRPLAGEKVKAMVLIGEDAPLLENAFGDIISCHKSDTLEEAVKRAAALAESGDCVLLAPACASFDMFQNYKHRGKVFKEAVEGLWCATANSAY